MDKIAKPALAELIGTFAFFFIGAGAICMDAKLGSKGYGLLGIALAHGVMLGVMVSAFGHLSGAHFNPAVTIGLLVGRKVNIATAVSYIIAQLIGGSLAGFTLKQVFAEDGAAVHYGTPTLSIDPMNGMLIEAVLTFFLVTVVFATAVDPRGAFNKIGGFGIGLTVMMDILVGGPLTGAAMNPARHFGTAVAANYWENTHVYWIGPIIGAVIASLIYTQIFLDEAEPQGR